MLSIPTSLIQISPFLKELSYKIDSVKKWKTGRVEEEEENDSWGTGWIFRFHGLVLIHIYRKYIDKSVTYM